jgi:hypothetical protein
VDELGRKLAEAMGVDFPLASFAFRRPGTAEESRRWKAEKVIIDPSSLDVVINEALRLHRETRQTRAPSSTPPQKS